MKVWIVGRHCTKPLIYHSRHGVVAVGCIAVRKGVDSDTYRLKLVVSGNLAKVFHLYSRSGGYVRVHGAVTYLERCNAREYNAIMAVRDFSFLTTK